MMSLQPNRMTRTASRRYVKPATGLTIIELMMAIVILGVIVALGAPAMNDFVIQSRMTSQANELLADISYARNEAATRGVRIGLCASTNANIAAATCSGSAGDWAAGRMVFVDSTPNGQRDTASGSTELLLKVAPTLTGSSTLVITQTGSSTPPGSFQFRPYGGITDASVTGPGGSIAALSFKLCPNTAGKQGRTIDIAVTGRPTVSKVSC